MNFTFDMGVIVWSLWDSKYVSPNPAMTCDIANIRKAREYSNTPKLCLFSLYHKINLIENIVNKIADVMLLTNETNIRDKVEYCEENNSWKIKRIRLKANVYCTMVTAVRDFAIIIDLDLIVLLLMLMNLSRKNCTIT